MPGFDVTVPTPAGPCTASLHVPDGVGPWPAVIMLPDIGSLRPAFRDMGERLAGLGFVTLVPDLYHRDAPYLPFDAATLFTEPGELPRARAMAGSLTPELLEEDVRAHLAFLAERREVAAGPVGTTGYCFGGKLSLLAAGLVGDPIGAAASFHGGGLAVDDDPTSPHHRADAVRAEVYVGAARDDRSFPEEQAERLDAALTAAGVAHAIETYDALHGFAVPDFAVFDHDASERHWAAMADLFGRALGGCAPA